MPHVPVSVAVNSPGGGAPASGAASKIQAQETLADAIEYLDAHGGGTATFASTMSGRSIQLTQPLPTIDQPITIVGRGERKSAVLGRGISAKSGSVFTIASGISGTSEIDGITIAGRTTDSPGAAISSGSDLVLHHVNVSVNHVTGSAGGALYADGGSLTLKHSVVYDNTVAGDGGGILAKGTDVTVETTAFLGDVAADGGAIAALDGSKVTLRRSTFSGDRARHSGAVVDGAGVSAASPLPVEVYDSTFAYNRAASNGGAFDLDNADLRLTAATLVRNSADRGIGVFQRGTGSVTIDDTVMADFYDLHHRRQRDLNLNAGTTTAASFSLIGNPAGTGISAAGENIVGAAGDPVFPNLEHLSYHGGPTMTMPPRPNSPVIDAGKAFGLTRDQRGFRRTANLGGKFPPGGDGTDIGAVEQLHRRPLTYTLHRRFGNQRVTLVKPTRYACPTVGEPFTLSFSSSRIHHSHAVKLRFKRAELIIGRGVRRVHRTAAGKRVVRFVPNRRTHQNRRSWTFRINRTPRLGYRNMRLILLYDRTFTVGGVSQTSTVKRVLHGRFTVC